MSQQDDRYGEAIRNLEKVREDQWAAEQDRTLLDQLQRRLAE